MSVERAGGLDGVRRSGTSVSKTARRRFVVEGKGLQEKRRVPKGWSGTEWPSLAHNSQQPSDAWATKMAGLPAVESPFPNDKGAQGAPERDGLGTMTWAHTVTLVHYQVERKSLGSLTASCRSHSRGVVMVFFAFAATSHHHQLPSRRNEHTSYSSLLYLALGMCHPTAWRWSPAGSSAALKWQSGWPHIHAGAY